MSRPFYVDGATGAFNLQPPDGDPICVEWPKLNRFAKICWNWADTYERLLRDIPLKYHARFEVLLKDYSYFRTKILDPTGVDVSENAWRQAVATFSKNATKSHLVSGWREWTNQDRDTFDRLCGSTMKRIGYDYSWSD
jgi:hypothetical protein